MAGVGRSQIGRALASVGLTLAVVLAVALALSGASSADVSAVKGSAYGYRAFNITLFGGAQPDTGPTPVVTLASDASNSPQSATAVTGSVTYGPATLFTSGPISVSTSGSLGASGSVKSSSNVTQINEPDQGEIFTADSAAGTCTASPSGTSGSTTVTNGFVFTDLDEVNPANTTTQTVATNPAPNTTISGKIVISSTDTETFNIVFNEQTTAADGSLTVNAAHEHLLGPTAKGDVIIGQAVCGVTVSVVSTADLSVTATGTPGTVAGGGTVTYTVTVANAGPDSATGATVTNTLSSGAKFASVTAAGTGDTCTPLKGKTRGEICSLGTLASGGSDTITIVAIAPHKAGTMSLTSTVSFAGTDPNPLNNTATVSTTVQ